jgi:hypothetical protein
MGASISLSFLGKVHYIVSLARSLKAARTQKVLPFFTASIEPSGCVNT